MRTAIEARDQARERQHALSEAVRNGRDAVALLPASGPQFTIGTILPALSLPRPTIIVTPRATRAEEHFPHLDRRALAARIYLTPEQLQSDDALELLRRNGASRLVIAPDLRHAYVAIAAVAWRLGRPPILACVRDEAAISHAIMLLGLRNPAFVRAEHRERRR